MGLGLVELVHWIEIYSLDSTIQLLNNWSLVVKPLINPGSPRLQGLQPYDSESHAGSPSSLVPRLITVTAAAAERNKKCIREEGGLKIKLDIPFLSAPPPFQLPLHPLQFYLQYIDTFALMKP